MSLSLNETALILANREIAKRAALAKEVDNLRHITKLINGLIALYEGDNSLAPVNLTAYLETVCFHVEFSVDDFEQALSIFQSIKNHHQQQPPRSKVQEKFRKDEIFFYKEI